jgi:transposase
MKKYIGLDVHCKWTVFVAQDSNGKVIKKGKVRTTPEALVGLVESVGADKGTSVGMESGTQATWAARLLAAAGMKPVVIEAREVRAKARRRGQKSDTRDAYEVCDGLRRGIFNSIVYVPSAEVERLRAVLSRRRYFVRQCASNVNAAKFILRAAGLGGLAKALVSWHGWRELPARPEAAEFRRHLLLHARAWRLAKRIVRRLEAELEEALAPFAAEAELMRTAPGVGPIVSATFIAAVATPRRFPTSRRLSSYLGLAPSSYDSGGTEDHQERSGARAGRLVRGRPLRSANQQPAQPLLAAAPRQGRLPQGGGGRRPPHGAHPVGDVAQGRGLRRGAAQRGALAQAGVQELYLPHQAGSLRELRRVN